MNRFSRNFLKYSYPTSAFLVLILLLVGNLVPIFLLRNTEEISSQEVQKLEQGIMPKTERINPKLPLEPPKKLPFSGFIQNQGQLSDNDIQYYYSSSEMSVGFGTSKITFVSTPRNNTSDFSFSLTFPEANPVTPVGKGKISHPKNYYYGDLHLTNVPSWDEVWFFELYPQIDMRYYMTTEGLKYEFIVRPSGNPSQIIVKVNGPVTLDVQPQTVTITAQNTIQAYNFQDTCLRVFQADRTPVTAYFASKDSLSKSYGFHVMGYDPNQPLIIDPLWFYFSTYLGGSGLDSADAIAIDSDGNSYIAGTTTSIDFPTHNANQSSLANQDVFVTKLNAAGDDFVYSTYLGGSVYESGYAIAVDTDGNCYVTGSTNSLDFPTQNPYNDSFGGGNIDIFISKLSGNGSLVYSSYFGGNAYDGVKSIAVDNSGNAYIVGDTYSTNFPTRNGFNDTGNGSKEGFLTKFNATGNGLVYSTFLGGSEKDIVFGVAVDNIGNAYVTGETQSSNFPTLNAYNDTFGGGGDGFVTKVNATGNGLVFSTFLGGSEWESGYDLAIDDTGNCYITGWTRSDDFPTLNAYNDTYGENYSEDAFVIKLNATGNSLVFSTFLGGSDDDYGNEIAVDYAGNVYITGYTDSANFPTLNAYNSTLSGTRDAFVTQLNMTGNSLVFSTFLGGSGADYGNGIAVDAAGNSYITGSTSSTDFPTYNAIQNETKGGNEAFVMKLNSTTDDICPIISSVNQSPSVYVTDQDNVTITANVTDNLGVRSVILYYKNNESDKINDSAWYTIPMTGTPYQATIGPFPGNTTLFYYVEASDVADNKVVSPMDAPTNYTEVIIHFSIIITTTPLGFNVTEETIFHYDFNATFPLSENFTWIFTGNGTTWLVINSSSGEISGFANHSHIGVWNITVIVEVETGEHANYTTFLIVEIMDIAPELTTQPTNLKTPEATFFQYDFNASIAYPSNLTWTISGNSTTWLTINSTSGLISGFANYSTIGVWNITITVTAKVGYPTTYTTFLTVTELTLQFTDVTPNQNALLYDIILLSVRVETNTSVPVEGIEVNWWLDDTLLNTTVTNATGHSTWLLQLTSAGTHHVEAKIPARGVQADIYLPTTDLEFWFNGVANKTTTLWLILGDNYTIHGQLVDGEGTPVPGVDLVYKLNDISLPSIKTDSNGWLNTTQLFLTARIITVTVLKDGMELAVNDSVVELIIYVVSSSPVVTVISPTTTMTETVIGHPVSFVGWIYFNETPPIAMAGARVGLLVNGTQVDSQFSDTSGYLYFSYPFVNSGTYRVAFYYNDASWGEIWVTVTAGYFASCTGPSTVNGTVGQALEFTIYVLSNTSTLHRALSVVLNNGIPVIGAQVDWYINEAFQNSTLTGSDGRASFSYFFATLGLYEIVAKHEGVILATFGVNIAEGSKEGLEKFLDDYAVVLLVLVALIICLMVIGAIPRTRRQVTRSLNKVKTLVARKAVFGHRYCARALAPELEEKLGQEALQTAADDPTEQEAIQREVSAKLTRFPEFMTKSVDEKVEFTQKTTELILKRYKK